MKKTWKHVNSIIRKGKNKDVIARKGFESDPHYIANCFNDYKCYKNLVSKIKIKHNFRQFLDQPIENSMFLAPTSAQEVEKCIESLDRKKSSNIYGMLTKFLKEICRTVSQVLSYSVKVFPKVSSQTV